MASKRTKSKSPISPEETKFLKKIGERVLKRFSETEETIEWLAWESDTSRATIRRIFDAERNIGILTLDRVAKALSYKNGVIDLINDL